MTQDPTPSSSDSLASPGHGGWSVGGFDHDATALHIEKDDPVATAVRGVIAQKLEDGEIRIPRLPDVASRILDFTKNPDASAKDVIRHVRSDPVLAGKILERANSAAFAGSQPVYSLQMAIVRLGMTSVSELAVELSGGAKGFAKEKRSNLLARKWKFSMATAFACEELARQVASEHPESAFLTGLFHAVAAPAIVETIGDLERAGEVPPQNDSRVHGLLDKLTTELSLLVVRTWAPPKEAVEAIALQDAKIRERRGKPMAHLLVCGKAIATELGMGARPMPIDFQACRDFHYLKLEPESKIEPARDAVMDKMLQVTRG
jgi:HD-like signal output (HDOD) protein